MKHASPRNQRDLTAIWQMVGLGLTVLISVLVLVYLTGPDAAAEGVEGDTTTMAPGTTILLKTGSSNDVPGDTAPGKTAPGHTVPGHTAPPTTRTPTTTAPTTSPGTTAVPTTTTTSPTTTEPVTPADRAIAVQNGNLVWFDPDTGDSEIIQNLDFEAEWGSRLGLSPDGSRVYYHLNTEDNWFSCESVSGEVIAQDLGSDPITVANGQPSLSPDGDKLAYLTTDDCHRDPDEPDFFLPGYDSLVIVDGDGRVRIPLEGDVDSTDVAALTDVVWIDSNTVFVADEKGRHYRVPIDGSGGDHLEDHDSIELGDWDLFAVTDGLGLAAYHDAPYGPWGRLHVIDLASLDARPISWENNGDATIYAIGISATGEILVSVGDDNGDHLLVDVDLETGDVSSVIDLTQPIVAIDW